MSTGLENLWIYRPAVYLEIKVSEIPILFSRNEIFRTADQLRRFSAGAANNIIEQYTNTSQGDKCIHSLLDVKNCRRKKTELRKEKIKYSVQTNRL